MRLVSTSCLIAVGLMLGTAAFGCSSADPGDGEGNASAITPTPKDTVFEQAQLCDSLVREKSGVRDADIKNGVVRWKCGDVAGVTFDRPGRGFGQEYCEYHAVMNGEVIDSNTRPNAPVQCVFTSAFADNGLDRGALGDVLKSQLKSSKTPAAEMVSMQVGFNSRNAATILIDDCQVEGKGADFADSERQVACLQAWQKADDATKKQLEDACKGQNLGIAANWKKATDLGVKELAPGPDFEISKDIAMCAHTAKLGNKVVTWRNSDPTICARAMRASHECGTRFSELPDGLQGFSMTSWIDDFDPSTPPQAPAGCAYAQVDGKPLQQLLVCTPDPAAVTRAKQAGIVMQEMCKEEFGNLIAMAAPLAAVASGGKEDTQFCKDFAASKKGQ